MDELMNRKNFLRSVSGLGLLSVTGSVLAKNTEINERSNVRHFGAKGDGKSDDTKAFEQALAQFGEAYVPKGVWCLAELKILGQRLYGVGTLKALDHRDTIKVMGRGSQIEGLRFATTNSRTKAEIRLCEGASDIQITQCQFEGKAYSVVAADQNGADDDLLVYKSPAQRVLFAHNMVRGYVVPVYLHNVTDILINDNFFTESFYDAIRTRQAVERIVISNNIFENIGISAEEVTRDAVDCFWSGRELIIIGNVIRKTGSIGFDIKGHEPKGKYHTGNVIVAHNYLEGTNYSSILLSSGGSRKSSPVLAGPIAIKHNTIVGGNRKGQSVHDAGIWLHHGVQHVQIVGNQIMNHQGHGISFTHAFPGAAKSRMIQVNDNMITGCRYKGEAAGIFGQQMEMLQIRQNMVDECDLTWSFERMPDSKAFRENLQMEDNFFKGKGKASPSADWEVYIASLNKIVR